MSAAPNAWDADWETIADKQTQSDKQQKAAAEASSRAERKARHAEANKQIWKAAEEPEKFHFLESKGNVPLKDEFRPQVKVLSRKPAPKVSPRGLTDGVANLGIADEDDSEEERRKKQEESLAERQRRAQVEREEKQRKYAEVRSRLFGPTGTQDSEDGSPGSARNAAQSDGRGSSRRTRGQSNRGSHHGSSAEQSPARTTNQPKQLYDPGYAPKPGSQEKRSVLRASTPKDEQPIRAPRGPDSSGRGGFGFASRGGGAA